MAVLVNSKSKKCVTCEYWKGTREPDSFGKNVRYNIHTRDKDEGTCDNRRSPKRNKEVRANSSGCSKWEKWQVLK